MIREGGAPTPGPVVPSEWPTAAAEVASAAWASIQRPVWERITAARAEAEAEA